MSTQQLQWPRETNRIQVPDHCLHTFNTLNTMIDEMEKINPDFSHFPKECTDILRKYAIKMTPQPGSVPTPFAIYDTVLKPNYKKPETLTKRGKAFIKTILTKFK